MYPTHFTNGPARYPRNGQFVNVNNYPPGNGVVFRYPGGQAMGTNMTQVPVEMHCQGMGPFNPNAGQFQSNPGPQQSNAGPFQPSCGPFRDQQSRRPAPQGTAAVVYRGGGTQPRPTRPNTQAEGENTYFVLDVDEVNNEPPAEFVDPMSLPRIQKQSVNSPGHFSSNGLMRSEGGQGTTDRRAYNEKASPQEKQFNETPVEPRTFDLVESSQTKAKFSDYDACGTGTGLNGYEEPLSLRKGMSTLPEGPDEHWPPPPLPSELMSKE